MMVHLTNQMLHFPLRSGAVRVNSVVVEHDDMPEVKSLVSKGLSFEAIQAPNIEVSQYLIIYRF